MRSSNPVLSRRDTFSRGGYSPSASTLEEMYAAPSLQTRRMTIDDVVMKTAILLGTVIVTGAAAWTLRIGMGAAVVAAIAGFVLAMVITFRRVVNPALIVTYAGAEGVFLGAVSRVFESYYSGIVIQAVLGTALTFVGMLFAYRSGAVKVTPRFTKMLIGAMFGILGLALVNLLVGFFVPGGLGLRTGGPLAIVFSLVCIAVAAFSLAMDFDMVERGVAQGAPERESWLAAFGLVVTLVWLYIEMLRFISYFRE